MEVLFIHLTPFAALWTLVKSLLLSYPTYVYLYYIYIKRKEKRNIAVYMYIKKRKTEKNQHI